MILTLIILFGLVFSHYLGYKKKLSKKGYQKIGFEQFKSFYYINPKTWGIYNIYVSKKFLNSYKNDARNRAIKKAEEEVVEYKGFYALLDRSYRHLREAEEMSAWDEIYFSFTYIDYFKYLFLKLNLSRDEKRKEIAEENKKEREAKLAKEKKDAEEYESLISCLKKEISTLEKDNNELLKKQGELLRSV